MIDIKKYSDSPNSCPYCNSESINAEDADFSDIYAWRYVNCNHCGKKWREEFTITAVLEEGE